MNLYFRVLKIFFLHLLRIIPQSRNPTQTFVLRFRTWPHDLDFNLHMNNGRYLTIMDIGRLDLMLRLGLFGKILWNWWMPVIGTAFVHFRKSLGPIRSFELHTKVAAWDEKWFYIEQTFMQNDTVMAVGYVKGLIRDKKNNIPSQNLFSLVGIETSSPPIPEVFLSMEQAKKSWR